MDSDRRHFLKSGLAAAPLFIPRSVWGANEKIAFGSIATGGRGRYLLEKFQKQGAQCVAVCDIYEPNLEKAKQLAPDAKTYVDYHELLQQPDVDCVVLAGPDHHHCPMLLAALDARKDVYAEKPLSKSLTQSRTMVEAVRKSDRIVQVGMQRRSAESLFKAKKLVDDGVLGRITLVKPQWHWNVAKPLDNSPLPGKIDWKRFLGDIGEGSNRAVVPMRFRYWRYFWDYAGGNMTDQGTHLMDVVQWFTNSAPPKAALCHGYVAKMTGAEHPDVFSALFEFPDFMATWTLDYGNSYENGWSITFMGDKATMILDEDGYTVWKEPWARTAEPLYQEKAPVPVESHIQNFLDCIKSRKQPNCTVEIAAQAVAGPHIANMAMVEQRKVKLAADGVSTS